LVELEFESLGRINCLIDSGSCVSVVKHAVVFNKYNLRKLKKPVTIVGIGNAKTNVDYFVEVVFGKKINNFLVVPDSFNISQEMLLGNDFLIKQNVEINFKNNTIRVNKKNLKMNEEIFEFSVNKNSASGDSFPDQSGSESQSENSFSDQSDDELDNAEFSQENSELSTEDSSASKSLCKQKRSKTKSKKDNQIVTYKVAVSSSSESDSEEEAAFEADEAKNVKCEKFVLPPRTQALRYVWVSSEREGIIPKRCWGEQIYNAECLVTPVNGRAPVLFMNASEKQWNIEMPELELEELDPKEDENEKVGENANIFTIEADNRLNKLSKQLNLKYLNEEEKTEISKILEEFSDVFFLEGDQISRDCKFKYRIDLTDPKPVNQRQFRVPIHLKGEMEKQVKEMLKDGTLRESESAWSLPVFLVPKKVDNNGKRKFRFVIDLRKLNEKMDKLDYPLPVISEILEQLGNSQYFSTVDLYKGFFQLGLEDESAKYTSFAVNGNKYEFVRLPMGLKNSPAFFMKIMNQILTGLVGTACLVYLDDIIVYGSSLQEHNERLKRVLKSLKSNGLKLQTDKCNLLRKEVIFLGHKLSKEGIEVDEEKLMAIRDFPRPKNVRELRGFIGLCTYYRKFIRDFGKIIAPLNKLTSTKVKFEWSDGCEVAFKSIKEKLMNPPVLAYPRLDEKMILTTDACSKGLGAVLSQITEGNDRPLAFASRALSEVEKKRFKDCATGLELLAMAWACNKFRQYLLAAHFEIRTDNKALTSFKTLSNNNKDIMKLKNKLEEYDFDVKYIKGKSNVVADALSRMFLINILNEDEKRNILAEFHDSQLGGHRGAKPTVKRIKDRGFTWNTIEKDVKNYIKNCEQCQKNKILRKTKLPLKVTDTPSEPWVKVAIDVVGPLPTTMQGNVYILTVQDNFSKFLVTISMKSQTAEETAENFVKAVILKYGIPRFLLSDQGSNFMSKLFANVKKSLRIKTLRTSAFHPQTNGALERAHRPLKDFLKNFINEAQNNWDELLPFAEFVYNTYQNEATKFEPSFLMFGRKFNLPSAFVAESEAKPFYSYDDYAKQLTHNLKQACRIAKENLEKRKIVQKQNYDKKLNEVNFKLGDQVLLLNETARQGRSKKLGPQWAGPYEIIEVLNELNFRIKMGNRIKVVHGNKLKHFYD
jgi:transposase InsO family protein